jgi:hypothetical protein
LLFFSFSTSGRPFEVEAALFTACGHYFTLERPCGLLSAFIGQLAACHSRSAAGFAFADFARSQSDAWPLFVHDFFAGERSWSESLCGLSHDFFAAGAVAGVLPGRRFAFCRRTTPCGRSSSLRRRTN